MTNPDQDEKVNDWGPEPTKKNPNDLDFKAGPKPLDPLKRLGFAGRILLGAVILWCIAALSYLFVPIWAPCSEPAAQSIWNFTSEFVKIIGLLVIGSYFSSKD